jgi:hypothetical protein
MKFPGSRQANSTITPSHDSNFSGKRTHSTLFLSMGDLACGLLTLINLVERFWTGAAQSHSP